MSKTEDLKRAIFAIADPDKVSPFNGDMVTLFLHEIEKLVESAIAAEREACAKHFERLSGTEWFAENVAEEIRARGTP